MEQRRQLPIRNRSDQRFLPMPRCLACKSSCSFASEADREKHSFTMIRRCHQRQIAAGSRTQIRIPADCGRLGPDRPGIPLTFCDLFYYLPPLCFSWDFMTLPRHGWTRRRVYRIHPADSVQRVHSNPPPVYRAPLWVPLLPPVPAGFRGAAPNGKRGASGRRAGRPRRDRFEISPTTPAA